MFDPFFGLLFLAAIVAPVMALIYWLKPKPRRSRNTGLVLLGCAIAAVGGFLYYVGPVLFVSNEGIASTYVLAPPSKVASFNDDLSTILIKYGFSQHRGKTSYGSGLAQCHEWDGAFALVMEHKCAAFRPRGQFSLRSLFGGPS